jgi:hypothetical protein
VTRRLEAAGGLALVSDEDGLRVEWSEPDWLGPMGLELLVRGERFTGARPAEIRPSSGEDTLGSYQVWELVWRRPPLPLRTFVRAYRERALLVFRIEASEDLTGIATRVLDAPAISFPRLWTARRRAGGVAEGTLAFAHQYTEFALPSYSDASFGGFGLLPDRPALVAPLWLNAPDGRSLMLAPLDAFHEQAIAVPRDAERAGEGVRCGWHGDLDAVPRGFATELALFAGAGPRQLLEAWAAFLRARHGTRRPTRYADDVVGRLSYWTDNGAAYWYRVEPGADMPATLERVARSLREAEIPFRTFELDSWWYPHQIPRAVGEGTPERVPPTGMLAWEPRPDVLPDGVAALAARIDAPLVLHSRHFSSHSPYWERYDAWRDGEQAHPKSPEFFDHLLAQAASWGAVSYEQDWLVESWVGVRGLREAPGRARAWQEALDRAAAANGLSLVWCMATPADFFQTVTLERVVSIRTSGDYRYLVGGRVLWRWFLLNNALARAFGLWPFKDVFLSSPVGVGIDGDPHAEAEALLAALSAGPVGIGDRAGRSDRALVLRTCRADGVLVKPDAPIAAIERCYRGDALRDARILVGETYSDHPAGRFAYVASFHVGSAEGTAGARVALADLGDSAPTGPVIAYDWRSGTCAPLGPGDALDVALERQGWDLRVLAPVLPGEIALLGDVSMYACAGDRRVRDVRSREGALELDVLGAPGERVEIAAWSARAPASVEIGDVRADRKAEGVRRDAATGLLRVPLRVGPSGRARLRILPA